MTNVMADEVVRIETPGCGAVSAAGSTWLDFREIVYAVAEELGVKPLKEEILAAIVK
jgi:hypothetical protein